MYTTILLTLFCVAESLSASFHPVSNDTDMIQLPTGRYKGLHNNISSTTVYYSIPYGYADRFKFPQCIDSKPGVSPLENIDATTYGPACPQFKLPPPYDQGFKFLLGDKPIEPQSEDCLTMDVYVPKGGHKDLPVLFFTPGGGFLVGASFPYDMRTMVDNAVSINKPFIGVTINYRLGPLGYLNPSSAGPDEINLGLWDQVEALRYVKKHIRAFGGDPSKVTIFGQSAGAESAMHQLLWTDEDLFRAAWLASVPAGDNPFIATSFQSKDSIITSYAEASGCPTNATLTDAVECLRKTDVSALINSSVAWEGSGTSLGGLVRDNVFRAVRSPGRPKVPVVFSSCRDEGTSAAIGFKSNNDSTTLIPVENLISEFGRLNASQADGFRQSMLVAYPDDPTLGAPFDGQNTTYGQPSQYKRMAAMTTDSQYTAGWFEFLQTFSQSSDTWGILFDEPIPGPGIGAAYGVQHGSDLPFYFPNMLGVANDPRNNGRGNLVKTMHKALAHFVNDLDPNGVDGGRNGADELQWVKFQEMGQVVRLVGTDDSKAVNVSRRPGWNIMRETLRPDGF